MSNQKRKICTKETIQTGTVRNKTADEINNSFQSYKKLKSNTKSQRYP